MKDQLRCVLVEISYVAAHLRESDSTGDRNARSAAEDAYARVSSILAILNSGEEREDADRDLANYTDAIRSIMNDKRGPDMADWALGQRYVQTMIAEMHEQGAHAGYAAARVRKYIATRGDLAVARNHEAGLTGGGKQRSRS